MVNASFNNGAKPGTHPTVATGSTIVGSSSPSPVRFTRWSTVHSRKALSAAGRSTSGPASPDSQVAKSALQLQSANHIERSLWTIIDPVAGRAI